MNWESDFEMIRPLTQDSRSAPVKVNFGFRPAAMLSGLALSVAFVSGCTEETPPEPAKPATPPAAVAPAKPGGAMAPATPPAKTEEKPK